MITHAQAEEARLAQAEAARQGTIISLAEALVQLEYITRTQRETVEREVRAQQQGVTMFGQYKLLKKLGEGGMGAVYLAEDTIVGRKVAVKVLPQKHAGDAEYMKRFRREAIAAGRLNHVNIVGAYTVGEERGQQYLVMEYCEGESLEKTLVRDGVIPCDKALEIVMQVARGLKHAHEHGFIHRDIKPANVFISAPLVARASPPAAGQEARPTDLFAAGFVAKILDLGLSKNLGAGEQSFNTQTGIALGSPHYIAPEQARGEKTIDGRADIYSLGATFYHLVTGQTPFHGSTAAMIMLKHMNEQLPNPQDIRDDIPDGVVHVIQKMMAKDAADRYADCAELLADLELVIDGEPPSSQALDALRSSVAMRRAVPAARPIGTARHQPVGTRRHEPVGAVRVTAARGARRHEPVAAVLVPDSELQEVDAIPPEDASLSPQDSLLKPQASRLKSRLVVAAVGGAVLLLLLSLLLFGRPTQSPIVNPQPATSSPQSPIPNPQSAIRNPQSPEPDWERIAANTYDEVTKFEGIKGDDTAGKIARLEEFVRQFGATAAAHKARDRIAALRKPAPTTQPAAPETQPEIKEPDTSAAAWTMLEPVAMDSSGGATLTRQGDGSVLVSGTSPDTDSYTLTVQRDLHGIAAVRLEVRLDKTLANNGPGRSENGNFVLTDFSVQADGKPVAFRGCTADYSQGGFPVAHAIDQNKDTGWAVADQTGRPHSAVFEAANPFDAQTLTCILDHRYGTKHTIGRFRLSVKLAASGAAPRPAPDTVVRPVVGEAVLPGLLAKAYLGDTDAAPLKDIAEPAIAAKTVENVNIESAAKLKELFGRPEYIGVAFSGFIEIPADGDYTFFTNSDDGTLLYIGDTLVVDNDGSHATQEQTGRISLKAGKQPFRLYYGQGRSEAVVTVSWSGPNLPKQVIPPSAFYHMREPGAQVAENWLSQDATYTVSSVDYDSRSPNLLNGIGGGGAGGKYPDYAFHTEDEDRPFIVVDLRKTCSVHSLEIVNRKITNAEVLSRARTLTAWASARRNGPWEEVWRATEVKPRWAAVPAKPVQARYVKLGLREKTMFHLFSVNVYGTPSAPLSPAGRGAGGEGEDMISEPRAVLVSTLWCDMQGGADYLTFGGTHKGGKAIWGKRAPHHDLTVTFALPAAPDGPATLVLTTYRHSRKEPSLIALTINGREIFSGPDPAMPPSSWSESRFSIPDGVLKAGANELRINNNEDSATEPGEPWYLVNSVRVEGALPLADPAAREAEAKKARETATMLEKAEQTLGSRPAARLAEPLLASLAEIEARLEANPRLLDRFVARLAGLRFDSLLARDGELGLYKCRPSLRGKVAELRYDMGKPDQLAAWTLDSPVPGAGELLPNAKKGAAVLKALGDRSWGGKERRGAPVLRLPFLFDPDNWVFEASASLVGPKTKGDYGILVWDGAASVMRLSVKEAGLATLNLIAAGNTPLAENYWSRPTVMPGRLQDTVRLQMACVNGWVSFAGLCAAKPASVAKVELGFKPRYLGLFVRTLDAADTAAVAFEDVKLTAIPDAQALKDQALVARSAFVAAESFAISEAAGLPPPEWTVAWTCSVAAKQGMFNGRVGAWETHPLSQQVPAKWTRRLKLDAGKPYTLRLAVSARKDGEWALVLAANRKEIVRRVIAGPEWQNVEVNLGDYAGQDVDLELRNEAGRADLPEAQFGYWDDVRISPASNAK